MGYCRQILVLAAGLLVPNAYGLNPPPDLPGTATQPSSSIPWESTPCCPPSLSSACCPTPTKDSPRVWGNVQYLLWWISDSPTQLPIVTTGNVANPLAGVFGQPDTRPVFGGSGLDYGTISGLRAGIGVWLDEDQNFGVEASGFLLERRSVGFSATSPGSPPLVVPFFDVENNFQTAVVAATQAGAPFEGSVNVNSRVRLWGGQSNIVASLDSIQNLSLQVLLGYQHLSLDENLGLQVRNHDLTIDIRNTYSDRFQTRNRFDGGQVGGRMQWSGDRIGLTLQGSVALGSTLQVVERVGVSSQTGGAAFAPGPHGGGIFVQPTNSGQLSRNIFTVVPSAQARLSYRVIGNLIASVGYDFLYWNGVSRAGQQIDHQVNASQSPINSTGILNGPPRPIAFIRSTDFFAHGVSLALEYKF